MLEKITLTKIFRTDKDKDGSPLMTKAGKPYSRINLKAQEYGESWISGFGNPINEKWTEGSTVDVIILKKDYEGKTYYNFETPKKEDLLEARISALELDMLRIKQSITQPKASEPAPAPKAQIDIDVQDSLDNVPF